jgi:hypothetical protein
LKKSETAILAYWGPTSLTKVFVHVTLLRLDTFFFLNTLHNGFLLFYQLISCILLLVPCCLASLENALFQLHESVRCIHPFKSFVSIFHLNVKSMHFHFSSYVGDFVHTVIKSQIQLASTVFKDHYDYNGTRMRANDRYHC